MFVHAGAEIIPSEGGPLELSATETYPVAQKHLDDASALENATTSLGLLRAPTADHPQEIAFRRCLWIDEPPQ
jgi:hypothetical protein